MSEPCKMFSVVMPYRIFEQLRDVAQQRELSVGRVIRLAVEIFLKSAANQESLKTGE
ncbi:MAG: hypothetical protein HY939_03735 [Gammaproteobacteria bacterium]|nr:hypothetical protein [Gammaproteobacteria bacterium]